MAEEFARFTGNTYRVAVADGSRNQRARAIDSGVDVVVVNYETVVSWVRTCDCWRNARRWCWPSMSRSS